LITCGLAGWWIVLQGLAPRRGTHLWVALALITFVPLTLNSLSVHHYYWLNAVGVSNVERRVADLIDQLPVRLPVALVIDPSDPETSIERGWTPDRLRMRLIALSDTTPPRAFYLHRPTHGLNVESIVVTNVRPAPRAGILRVPVFQENMPSVETMWLMLPVEYAPFLLDVPFDARTDTLWRPPVEIR
jgi:hypothetical protein